MSETRHGARVQKVYDSAKTQYQRLLESGILTQAKRIGLSATYGGLNTARLLSQLNANPEQLWRMAERSKLCIAKQRTTTRTQPTSVTAIVRQ